MEFWRYYRIIRRRRWLIILGMMVCIGAVAIDIYRTKPLYTAKTTLMESRGMTRGGTALYPEQYLQLDLQLQLSNLATIATSQRVLSASAETLSDYGLKYSPEQILASTVVQPERDTNILAVEVTLPSGKEAKIAADVIAGEFKQAYGELNNAAVRQSREFIEAQLDTTRKAMAEAQEALKNYKEANQIAQLDYQTQSAIQRASQAKVDNNSAGIAYAAATAQLAKIHKEITTIPEWETTAQTTTKNPVWQSLKQELVSLETQRAGMINGTDGQQRRGLNHPEVKAIDERIREAKAQIGQGEVKEEMLASSTEAKNPVYSGTLDRWIQAKVEEVGADARRAATSAVLGQMQVELGELPAKEAQLAQLQLDVKAATDTYGLMRSKLDEAKIREQQARNEVALKTVDSANVFPVNQRKLLKLMLALFLSPLLGVGVAFLLHYTDNTVKTPAEAERLLGLPVLAVIPGSKGHSLPRQKCPEILDVAYQMLTSNIWIANQNQGLKSMAVVAAEPDVGRSVTASNLAVALAREGARVILVDADLRQPTQHLIFGVDNKVGLTNVITGGATLEDALVPTRVQGLLLIPTGPTPDNPVKLLKSTEMKESVESLRELADFVIYDTPSGVAFPDAVLVSSYVGNAVVVHSAGRVPRDSEPEFRARLESVGVSLIGVVLNKVRREDSSGYFHYRRSYEGVPQPKLAGGTKPISS